MIIQNFGLKTNSFYLPPFHLIAEEILVINLLNREDSYDATMFLKDIFCGNIKNENVNVYKKMTFAKHFIEPEIRRRLYPVTVGEYLKKEANLKHPLSKKIYEYDWINEKTKFNKLPGNPRRLLTLSAVLSKTNNLIFDMAGQDLQGRHQTFEIVKNEISKGGSAILLDNFDYMKNECTVYIEIQWLK